MSEIKDLNKGDAIEKLKSLAENKTCLFCTYSQSNGIDCRPMMTQGIEENGILFFFSKKDSTKNRQLKTDKKVDLLYTDTGSDSYLFVKGYAKISNDQQIIDKLWTPFAKTWFKEGKDDRSLTLIQVTPTDAHYWDTKHGKMVSTMKILISALTGASMDDGREGDIRLVGKRSTHTTKTKKS